MNDASSSSNRNSLTRSQAVSSLRMPDCVICADILSDPRQLPCGHCYCGPPRTCLQMLKQNRITPRLKCALCATEHLVDISSLKPMYGLRDYLEEQREIQTNLEQISLLCDEEIMCRNHMGIKTKFWCKNCEELICDICTNDKRHRKHAYINFRYNFPTIIGDVLRKKSTDINKKINEVNSNITECQKELISYEKITDVKAELEAHRDQIDCNLTKLKRIASGREANLDLKLFKWLLDGNAWESVDVHDLIRHRRTRDIGTQSWVDTRHQSLQTSHPKTCGRSTDTKDLTTKTDIGTGTTLECCTVETQTEIEKTNTWWGASWFRYFVVNHQSTQTVPETTARHCEANLGLRTAEEYRRRRSSSLDVCYDSSENEEQNLDGNSKSWYNLQWVTSWARYYFGRQDK